MLDDPQYLRCPRCRESIFNWPGTEEAATINCVFVVAQQVMNHMERCFGERA